MRKPRILALAVALAVAAAADLGARADAQRFPPPAGVPSCPRDSPAQVQARADALEAVRQITRAAHSFKTQGRMMYPTWEELKDTPPLRPAPRLRLDWGTPEPLPGWRIHYVTDGNTFMFTLTGVRDRCDVTFVADDAGVMLDGRPIRDSAGYIVPLSSR